MSFGGFFGRGANLRLALRVADAQRTNHSDPSITLRARGLVSADGATRLDLDEALPFDGRLGGYRLDQKTTGLAAGAYELSLEVSGDPVVHTVPFRVR